MKDPLLAAVVFILAVSPASAEGFDDALKKAREEAAAAWEKDAQLPRIDLKSALPKEEPELSEARDRHNDLLVLAQRAAEVQLGRDPAESQELFEGEVKAVAAAFGLDPKGPLERYRGRTRAPPPGAPSPDPEPGTEEATIKAEQAYDLAGERVDAHFRANPFGAPGTELQDAGWGVEAFPNEAGRPHLPIKRVEEPKGPLAPRNPRGRPAPWDQNSARLNGLGPVARFREPLLPGLPITPGLLEEGAIRIVRAFGSKASGMDLPAPQVVQGLRIADAPAGGSSGAGAPGLSLGGVDVAPDLGFSGRPLVGGKVSTRLGGVGLSAEGGEKADGIAAGLGLQLGKGRLSAGKKPGSDAPELGAGLVVGKGEVWTTVDPLGGARFGLGQRLAEGVSIDANAVLMSGEQSFFVGVRSASLEALGSAVASLF